MQRIPIIYYHRIDLEDDPKIRPFCVRPAMFKKQMAWMNENGYKTISLNDYQEFHLSGKQIPEKSFLITFDDGYYCNFTQAFPILQKFGFHANIFLIADFIATRPPAHESRDSYLTVSNILEMQRFGFSFQSHGCSHQPLESLRKEQIIYEAIHSKIVLEDLLQNKVDFFCYPFNSYNEEIKRIIRDEGYKGACGGVPVPDGVDLDWYEIGRTEIFCKDPMYQFKFKLNYGLSTYFFTKRQLGRVKKKLLGINLT